MRFIGKFDNIFYSFICLFVLLLKWTLFLSVVVVVVVVIVVVIVVVVVVIVVVVVSLLLTIRLLLSFHLFPAHPVKILIIFNYPQFCSPSFDYFGEIVMLVADINIDAYDSLIVPIGVATTVCSLSSGMMTSSNGNIFRVTGPLCGEFTGPGEFPAQRPVTRSFDVFFDLRLNKRLSKQPWGWWFETPSWSLWRQCNGCKRICMKFGGFSLHHETGMVKCKRSIYVR